MKIIKKLLGIEKLENQIHFIYSLQIALLRRYNIPEEEMAKMMTDEDFISELYANNLMSLLEKVKNVEANKVSGK